MKAPEEDTARVDEAAGLDALAVSGPGTAPAALRKAIDRHSMPFDHLSTD